MSAAPSMPMFWDAYLADTTHLSLEEHGALCLLLGAMWRRNGSVPNDDRDLARILGVSKPRWKKLKARLAPLLLIDEASISQKRLKKEWDWVQETRAKNAQNGAKGGRPRKSNINGLSKANAFPSVSSAESPHTHTQSQSPPKSPFELKNPDWRPPADAVEGAC